MGERLVALLEMYARRIVVVLLIAVAVDIVVSVGGTGLLSRRVVAAAAWLAMLAAAATIRLGPWKVPRAPLEADEELDRIRLADGMTPLEVVHAQRAIAAGRANIPAHWVSYARAYGTRLLGPHPQMPRRRIWWLAGLGVGLATTVGVLAETGPLTFAMVGPAFQPYFSVIVLRQSAKTRAATVAALAALPDERHPLGGATPDESTSPAAS